MKTIEVGSDLSYDVLAPTSFLFQIAAMQNDYQHVVSESLKVTPPVDVEACQVGPLGNRLHRLEAEPGRIVIRYRATVELDQLRVPRENLAETRHSQLPAEVLPFLNPSRYCESDKLLQFAWEEFGDINPGYDRVQRITDWVSGHMSYVPGSTGPTTTACDVLLQRTGVCRDYAHLGIAMCRALGVPARYVAGYAVDLQPPDFHGFFEVYLDHNWFLFDATRLAPVSGFVRIGVGRDAADVSFATRIGAADSDMPSVWAQDVTPAKDTQAHRESDAVSTAG